MKKQQEQTTNDERAATDQDTFHLPLLETKSAQSQVDAAACDNTDELDGMTDCP